jgi:maltooligosyltrehalose synthase
MSEDGPGRDWSAAEKSAYRRLVRAHHPDFGGDPDTFAAELARFHARREAPRDDIVFVTKRRGLGRIVDAVSTHRRKRRRPPRVR